MNKFRSVGAIVLGCLALAACGSTHAVTSSAQFSRAEAVAKACITRGAPAAIIKCIAPPGHSKAFTQCALTAATHNFYSHRRLIEGLATCVERDR